jgi:hypothetical protein
MFYLRRWTEDELAAQHEEAFGVVEVASVVVGITCVDDGKVGRVDCLTLVLYRGRCVESSIALRDIGICFIAECCNWPDCRIREWIWRGDCSRKEK